MLGGGASALTSPPARIHLSSSTKMSLHDRFTKLAKNRVEAGLNDSKSSSSGAAAHNHPASAKTLGSAKNRRLAMQMANRPSVKAALKIKKRSIRQRLGGVSALAARTGGRVTGNNRRMPGVKRLNQQRTPLKSPGKSPLKSRLSTTNSPGAGIDPSRLSFNNAARSNNKAQLALRLSGNNGRIRTKQVYVNSNRLKQRVTFNQNNNPNINRGPNNNRNNRNNNNNPRNGRGGGNRRNGNRPNPNGAAASGVGGDPTKVKQNLDMDLAQYMAKSKSHLDADLDVYMAQSSTTN